MNKMDIHLPIHPPSTTRTCPDTYALDLLAKNTTLPLKSSGTPHLPAGILSLILLNLASSFSNAVFISVSIYPGAIALTVTPFDDHLVEFGVSSCYMGIVDEGEKSHKLWKIWDHVIILKMSRSASLNS
jgi:hypothetical protein